jgi:phage shock protein C
MESGQQPEGQERLFDKMDEAPHQHPFKKFQRSRNNVIISGVCSGIADYFGIDAGLVRVLALLTLLLGAWSIIVYLITASLMPVDMEQPIQSGAEHSKRHKENFRVVLSGVLILVGIHFALAAFGLTSSARIFFMPHSLLFSIAVFFLGVTILINRGFYTNETVNNIEEKLFRTIKDRRLLGVCGGLGKYMNVDSSSLRIIFVLLTLLTLGVFVLIYVLVYLLTPFETSSNFE